MLLCTQLFYYVALFKKVPALRTEVSSGDNCLKIGAKAPATLLLSVICRKKPVLLSLVEDESQEDKTTNSMLLSSHLSFQVRHSRVSSSDG